MAKSLVRAQCIGYVLLRIALQKGLREASSGGLPEPIWAQPEASLNVNIWGFSLLSLAHMGSGPRLGWAWAGPGLASWAPGILGLSTWIRDMAHPYNARARNVRACLRARARAE